MTRRSPAGSAAKSRNSARRTERTAIGPRVPDRARSRARFHARADIARCQRAYVAAAVCHPTCLYARERPLLSPTLPSPSLSRRRCNALLRFPSFHVRASRLLSSFFPPCLFVPPHLRSPSAPRPPPVFASRHRRRRGALDAYGRIIAIAVCRAPACIACAHFGHGFEILIVRAPGAREFAMVTGKYVWISNFRSRHFSDFLFLLSSSFRSFLCLYSC